MLWAIWDLQENLTRVAKAFLTASLEIYIYSLYKILKVEKNNSLNTAQKAINSFSCVQRILNRNPSSMAIAVEQKCCNWCALVSWLHEQQWEYSVTRATLMSTSAWDTIQHAIRSQHKITPTRQIAPSTQATSTWHVHWSWTSQSS